MKIIHDIPVTKAPFGSVFHQSQKEDQQVNQLPEMTLFYATVATERLSDKGNLIFEEYLFNSKQETIDFGLDYQVATWDIINAAADVGNCYPNIIIHTPQGDFVGTEIYENDVTTNEMIESNFAYRPHGAPDHFCEAVEYHLFWNKKSELLSVGKVNGRFEGKIKNASGDIVIIH